MFDNANWDHEPDSTWDQLLDMRAQQIAARNRPIVLYFSGGTDSYTIYKVFERNNIHIDVAYIVSWPTETREQALPIELMMKHWYDPHTKMIVRDSWDLIKNQSYLDPNWIWEKGYRYQFAYMGPDEKGNMEIAQMLNTDDFVSILGFEKPRLHFDSTGVYSYQDDENFVRCMGDSRMDCFYVSPDLPELHIKQSYMLMNYIKSLRPGLTSPDQYRAYNNIHSPQAHPWLAYSIDGCGRFGDINDSGKIHNATRLTRLSLPTDQDPGAVDYHGRIQLMWDSLIGTKIHKNYTDAIMSVATDAAGKYLVTDPGNFYSMKQFRSKYYKLTFN